MATGYTHQGYDLDGYRESTEIYERLLGEWPGEEMQRRAGAYLETLKEVRTNYGENSVEITAALYYLMMWSEAVDPERAVDAGLALVEAGKHCFGALSKDMSETLSNLVNALLKMPKNTGFPVQVAAGIGDGLRISLARHLDSAFDGEDTFFVEAQEHDLTDAGAMGQLLSQVAELKADFDKERFEALLDQFVAEIEACGRSGDLDSLVSCLDASGEHEPSVGELPDVWISTTVFNIDAALNDMLKRRPNREIAQAREEVDATLAIGKGPEELGKVRELLAIIRDRAQVAFADFPYERAKICSEAVLAQGPERSLAKCSVAVELGDAPDDVREALLDFMDYDVRYLSLYDCYLSEYELEDIAFSELPGLETLHLASNQIGRLPGALLKHPGLEYLNLWLNKGLTLSADDVDWPKLKFLDLRRTSVSAQDIAALRKKYPQATVVAD